MTTEDDSARINELDIVRAPGFEKGGFRLEDLSPGINLIHGPNAAGKTTTAASIEKVLWPDTTDDGEQLVGHLSLNGDQWRVDVTNGVAEYQCNGQDTTSPNLPSLDHRDRYRLSLHDLLQQDTRNESFAETIERESAGGYDLAAAHDDLDYKSSHITRNKREYQNAKSTIDAWREERNEAKGLEEERSRLTKLRDQLESAEQAKDTKEALEQAITYQKAKSAYEKAKSELEEYPAVLDRVTGDEFQQIERLDGDLQDLKQEKSDAQNRKQDAKETLEEIALPDEGVTDGVISQLKQRRDTLADAESQARDLKKELSAAKDKRHNAREDIPLDVKKRELIKLDPGAWRDVSEFARRAEKVQAEREFKQSVKRWAGSDDLSEDELSSLKRASNALEEWLITVPEPDVASESDAAFHIGIASALVVSLAGVALGVLVNPVGFAVILVGLGFFIYGYLQRGGNETTGNKRAPHRRSFEQTEIEPPVSWTEQAVQERLIEIYDRIAEYEVNTERQQQRDTLLGEGDLDSKEEALDKKRKVLKERLGAAPDTTDFELAVIVRRVLDWQSAHDEVVALQTEVDETIETLEEAKVALQSELDDYGYESIKDSADATEAILDLDQRKTQYQNATREITNAEETIDKAKQKIAKLKGQKQDIFTTLELESGDREKVEWLCDQLDDYEEAVSELDKTEAVVDQEERELETLLAYDPGFKDKDIPELKEELREVKETANRHAKIQKQIADIEAKIDEAKSNTAVENAIAEKDRALNALKEQLDADYSAMVGDMLIDHIQDVTIEANRPAVFQRANELLATITYGRYQLDLDEGEQTFRAFDTANQKELALDELSSGTRVQILLAVRLAFVKQQEQGAKLPIVLDETLANTDDLRAKVIIESLIKLANEGRQIFYLTAQGDEIAKWHDALDDTTGVEWSTIDLAEVQDLDSAVQIPDLDSIESLHLDLPETSGHDYDSYGDALGVDPFNPYDGVGAAHLWYVLDDIEVLHDLLELGIERWGNSGTWLSAVVLTSCQRIQQLSKRCSRTLRH